MADYGLTMQVRIAYMCGARTPNTVKREVGVALDAEDPLPLAEDFVRRGQQARTETSRKILVLSLA
jgi:hypothetical protein